MKRLLLLSNSTNFGSGYLDHAIVEILSLFAGLTRIAFVPFALQDQAAYAGKARARFEREGIAVDPVTADAYGRALVASAGTNIAAPTIKTTNDMPIVAPPSFEALGLLGFQVNPHYVDADAGSSHMGETREDRLREYLEENETPVLGIREGAWLEVLGEATTLGGANGAKLFRRGHEPREIAARSRIDVLLADADR